MKRVFVLMVALLIGVASGAAAQISTGNLYGSVIDQKTQDPTFVPAQ